MKKRLSIILMSSIIAVSFAGCQSGATDHPSDNQTSSETEDSVSISENSTDINSQSSTENITEGSTESGTESSIESTQTEQSSDESMSETSNIENISCSYNFIDISDKMMSALSTDFSKPAIFTITSSEELNKFYEKNKTAYSLDMVDSGYTFSDVTKDYGEEYFAENDIIIVIQTYNKNDDIDLGYVTSDGSNLKIQMLKNEPSSPDNTSFSCAILHIAKKDRKNAVPVVYVSEPWEIDPEIGSEVVTDESTDEQSSNV